MLDMLTHMHKQTSSNSHQQHACWRAGAFQGAFQGAVAVPISQSPQRSWCMRRARFCILHAHTHAQANLDHPTFAAHLSSTHAKESAFEEPTFQPPDGILWAVSISRSPQHSWWGLVLAETCPAQRVTLHNIQAYFLEGCGLLIVYACTVLLCVCNTCILFWLGLASS